MTDPGSDAGHPDLRAGLIRFAQAFEVRITADRGLQEDGSDERGQRPDERRRCRRRAASFSLRGRRHPPFRPPPALSLSRGSRTGSAPRSPRRSSSARPRGCRCGRDVVEGDDADQAVAVDHRQPAHPVLDHQRRRLVELHLRVAADQRPRGEIGNRRGGATPSAKTRTARSRSVTIATGASPWSTTTTEPTRWSRISRATVTEPRPAWR